MVGQQITARHKFGRSGRILVSEVVRESGFFSFSLVFVCFCCMFEKLAALATDLDFDSFHPCVIFRIRNIKKLNIIEEIIVEKSNPNPCIQSRGAKFKL